MSSSDRPDTERHGPIDPSRLSPADDVALFGRAAERMPVALSICDPHQADYPIVAVNDAFLDLTGYTRDEVLGRNCRFLQGVESDPAAIACVGDAITARESRTVEILNYRKDGSTFWNALSVGPIHDAEGRLTHLYGTQRASGDLARSHGVQSEVEGRRHRTRNLFTVIASIVQMSARDETESVALAARIRGRLQALGIAHEIVQSGSDRSTAELRDLSTLILRTTLRETQTDYQISGPPCPLGIKHLTTLGLVLHELAIEASSHRGSCRLRLEWRHVGDALRLDWHEDGIGIGPGITVGSRLARNLVTAIGGNIEAACDGRSISVVIILPAEK